MNSNEIETYRMGYDEFRNIMLGELRELLSLKRGIRRELERLIAITEIEQEEDHWRSLQEEFPGITREEYEAELEASFQYIREQYYDENENLKPRRPKLQCLSGGEG